MSRSWPGPSYKGGRRWLQIAHGLTMVTADCVTQEVVDRLAVFLADVSVGVLDQRSVVNADLGGNPISPEQELLAFSRYVASARGRAG